MGQKNFIKTEHSTSGQNTDWTRSFPKDSVQGSGWMLDVLEDLQAYAQHHGLEQPEDLLADTRRKLARMLHAH